MSSGPGVGARVMVASVIGSAIEWFDYFLYGTLAAAVFGPLFFPADDPTTGLMLAYGAFAIAFFVRPLGGILFARLGDRVGRKAALVATLTLMGGSTALMGLLPTYGQIGVLAPLLLILLRMVQGAGIGGEWGGALLLVYEHAPENRKGLYGSLPQTGVTIGMLLSTGCVALVSLLPEPAFMSWGWRLPFVASLALVLLGLWVRNGVKETPEFRQLLAAGGSVRSPLSEALRTHRRAVLVAIGAKFVETAPFYIFTVFVVGYATRMLGYTRPVVLGAVTAGALAATAMIPLCGRLADRYGRRPVFLAGAVLTAAFVPAYFLLLSMRSTAGIVAASIVGIGVVWPLVTAALGTLFSEIFTTEVRYTGVTLGYQIGATLAGGTAPAVATWLLHVNDNHWGAVAVYIALTAAVSIVAVARGVRAPGEPAGRSAAQQPPRAADGTA
ncbi:MAG: MHS family MFS transporter [Gammaproteobacteria bacterium]|nr:MHS family MFS transporter [Gammaproteobacteria bacterium]